MKRIVSVAVVAVVVTSMCACASVPQAGPASSPDAAASPYGPDVDGKRVAAINRLARSNGLEIHWINYPQARPLPSGVVPAPVTTGG